MRRQFLTMDSAAYARKNKAVNPLNSICHRIYGRHEKDCRTLACGSPFIVAIYMNDMAHYLLFL